MTTNGALNGHPVPPGGDDNKDTRLVFFLDIDNCLYSKDFRIHDIMGELIDDYFQTHLSLTREDASTLHQRYYKDYGLAIEGLVRHHKIDPLEYNRQVDDALPLDDIIKPDPELRRLLERVDREKVKLWLFTNAYITHGRRVVKLLGIEDLFEGITYCDYGDPSGKLLCKPAREMFVKAMRQAGLSEPRPGDSGAGDLGRCYFVDDSALNAAGGKEFGWKTAHLVEKGLSKPPPEPVADFEIGTLYDLPKVFPELFKGEVDSEL